MPLLLSIAFGSPTSVPFALWPVTSVSLQIYSRRGSKPESHVRMIPRASVRPLFCWRRMILANNFARLKVAFGIREAL